LEAGVFVLVNVTYVALLWETFERAEEREISAQARRMMRVRSFLTLGAFTIAMLLSLKFPLWGLGLVYGRKLSTPSVKVPGLACTSFSDQL
jgi:hypothetical protein